MSKRADQDRAPIDNVSQQPAEAPVYVAPGSIFLGVSNKIRHTCFNRA